MGVRPLNLLYFLLWGLTQGPGRSWGAEVQKKEAVQSRPHHQPPLSSTFLTPAHPSKPTSGLFPLSPVGPPGLTAPPQGSTECPLLPALLALGTSLRGLQPLWGWARSPTPWAGEACNRGPGSLSAKQGSWYPPLKVLGFQEDKKYTALKPSETLNILLLL